MVRRPALEVIDYIENADLHYPPLRILFCILKNTLIEDPFEEK